MFTIDLIHTSKPTIEPAWSGGCDASDLEVAKRYAARKLQDHRPPDLSGPEGYIIRERGVIRYRSWVQ
jgi:hypothetical protein